MPGLIAHSEQGCKHDVRHFRRERATQVTYSHAMKLRIKELRQAAGLTVEALADRAGMSKSYLSEIENGVKQANARVLELLARALNCTVVDLIDQADTDPAILDHLRRLADLSPAQRQSIFDLTRHMRPDTD